MVFSGACMFSFGGCAWFFGGHGGHAWFFSEGVHVFFRGACVVFFGGCVVFWEGACMVFWGGMRGFFGFRVGGQYASYWNAFLFEYIYILFNIYEKDRDEHCYPFFSNFEEYIICIT